MKQTLFIVLSILAVALVFLRENQLKRPDNPTSEGCLFCHDKVSDPDAFHPVSAFGCYSCHLGNRFSMDKERAHETMVMKPGDLRNVDKTCGKIGCHQDMAARVKTSLMATNTGILQTIQQLWPKEGPLSKQMKGSAAGAVTDLYESEPRQNLAVDHYRKMCAGCHLWKERGDHEGEIGKRGGGCSDCHVIDGDKSRSIAEGRFEHPRLTTRIPSENCVKCHNRSARIGLSYFGRFESAGYGTPYEGADLSSRRLSGNRHFLNLPADVHFSKANMECIDCHTAVGVMGDGRAHHYMSDQVDITCEACHHAQFSTSDEVSALAVRMASLNRKVPSLNREPVAVTRKGTPLYNLRKEGDKTVFYRKKDGNPIQIDSTSPEKPYHTLKGHDSLSCQACHSLWIPQCFGCHLSYRESEKQYDWISDKKTPGRWEESRSYLRFSKPALGVKDNQLVYPISPCQVYASVFDGANAYSEERSFEIINIAAFDPHTTSGKSRPCFECHSDPKVLGLGYGILYEKDHDLAFRPVYDSARSGLKAPFPLDAYADIDGKPLQSFSKDGIRPFNRQEILKIISVEPCIGCHNGYDDPIYKDFKGSINRFKTETDLPCRK